MNDWLDAENRIERALQLSDAEQWNEALAELEAAITINPRNPAWHAQRGQILDQLERYDEAVEAYSRACELGDPPTELMTALGIDLIRTEKLEEAIQLYEKLARAHPDYEPAYCHRIAAYTRLNDHESAEQMFYLAQQLTDKCPNCYHHMGESLGVRNILPRAIYCWQRALELEPDYPHARQRIAEAYRIQGQHAKAREYYLAAMRADPGNTELLADLGDLLVEMNDLPAAASKFQHVLDLDPQSVRANVMLGLIASQNNDPDVAIRHFEAALQLDEHYPGLHSHLGEAELRRDRHEPAMRHLAIALDDDPEDCIALMSMGNCLLELLRPSEAAELFERAIQIEPTMVGAHHNLAVCRFLDNQFEQGIQHCLDALEIDPRHAMVLHKLALAYLHLGRWADARAMIARGLRSDPYHSGLKSVSKRFWMARLRHLARRFLNRVPGLFPA